MTAREQLWVSTDGSIGPLGWGVVGRGGTRRSRTTANALRNAEAAAAAQRDSVSAPLVEEQEGMHAAFALTDFANAVAAQVRPSPSSYVSVSLSLSVATQR